MSPVEGWIIVITTSLPYGFCFFSVIRSIAKSVLTPCIQGNTPLLYGVIILVETIEKTFTSDTRGYVPQKSIL